MSAILPEMNGASGDPLALGQRIVAILESGARTATYKLATLIALIEHCVEHAPAAPDAELAVSVKDLAQRVVTIYWRQVLPFEGQELRQSTQPVARILEIVQDLRRLSGVGRSGLPLEAAALRVPAAVAAAVEQVAIVLARQPLHRLQKLPGASQSPTFLYDDTWMHDRVSRRTLDERDWSITLYPGVAAGLARLSGLLKPTIEVLWVDDVRRMNRRLDSDVPDVAGHLFGRDRLSLAPVRAAFSEAFGPTCFYCGRGLRPSSPVDHVLPWSRVGIDGLANLVLACQACNGSKLHALPALELVERVLDRDLSVLEQVAEEIAWPTQYDRVRSAARGLYRGEPQGAPTWRSVGSTAYLDLSASPAWLS